MSTDPPRRIARIVLKLEFAPGIPEDRRTYLEHVARTCPVAKSIHADTEIDLKFSYPD